VFEVVEEAVGTAAVEPCVIERQLVRIRFDETHAGTVRAAPASLVDQRATAVDADDFAVCADEIGRGERVVAGARTE
jgi:hypothetical protein